MWRNTGQPVRILMLDARACLPIVAAGLLELDHALHRNHRVHVLLGDLALRADVARDDRPVPALAGRARPDRGAGVAPKAARVSAVDVEAVGRTMRVLFERAEQPIVYHDPATGAPLTVDPAVASAPDGFLPAVLVAGEAVWRETTGKGFGLDIQRDPSGLLGYRVRGDRGGQLQHCHARLDRGAHAGSAA